MQNKTAYTVLPFAGNIISIPECRQVADAIRTCFRGGNKYIAVDMAAVSEISGSFTGFLADIFKEINTGCGSFFFFNVNRKICEVLETLGMGALIRNEFNPAPTKPVVLIVEDDDTVRELTREYLTDLGYGYLEAQNGKEGLELYQKHRDEIAFLLMDIEMPVMDGQQLFEELHKIDPHVRVIMATGYTHSEKIRKIKSLKDVEILQKPYFCSDLEKAIQTTFRKSAYPPIKRN